MPRVAQARPLPGCVGNKKARESLINRDRNTSPLDPLVLRRCGAKILAVLFLAWVNFILHKMMRNSIKSLFVIFSLNLSAEQLRNFSAGTFFISHGIQNVVIIQVFISPFFYSHHRFFSIAFPVSRFFQPYAHFRSFAINMVQTGATEQK